MKITVKLQNDAGLVREVPTGVSWTGFFFTGFVLLFRGIFARGLVFMFLAYSWQLMLLLVAILFVMSGDPNAAIGVFLVCTLLACIANFIFLFKLNKWTTRYWLERGYRPVGPGWDTWASKVGVVAPAATPTPPSAPAPTPALNPILTTAPTLASPGQSITAKRVGVIVLAIGFVCMTATSIILFCYRDNTTNDNSANDAPIYQANATSQAETPKVKATSQVETPKANDELTDEIIKRVVTSFGVLSEYGEPDQNNPLVMESCKIIAIVRSNEGMESQGIGGTAWGTRMYPVKVVFQFAESNVLSILSLGSPMSTVFYFYQDEFHVWKAIHNSKPFSMEPGYASPKPVAPTPSPTATPVAAPTPTPEAAMSSVDPTAQTTVPSREIDQSDIQSFIVKWLNASNSGNVQVIADLFAGSVYYYEHGLLNTEQVIENLLRDYKETPIQHYSIERILNITKLTSTAWTVSFVTGFYVQAQNKKGKAGTVIQNWVVGVDQSGNMRILSAKSQTTKSTNR